MFVNLCIRTDQKDRALAALDAGIQWSQKEGLATEATTFCERLLTLDPSRGDIRRLLMKLRRSRTATSGASSSRRTEAQPPFDASSFSSLS